MTLEPSVHGPKEKKSENAIPDFSSLWDQIAGLSSLLHHLEIEVRGERDNDHRELIESIERGDVDPEKDWCVNLDYISCSAALSNKFEVHLLASYRQIFYFTSLYNNNFTIELNVLLKSEKKKLLADLHAKLLLCVVWGYWHYNTALKLQSSMRLNKRNRARKAASYKATMQEDSLAFLRTLVRSLLKNRPVNGWPIRYDTAAIIAFDIEPLLDKYGVEIPERGDDLIYRIDQMIEDDSSLKRLYKDNR